MFESLVFVCAVLLVGVCAWMARSVVESDPDPFYLNLTFFALGGQSIKTIECFADPAFDPEFAFPLMAALLIGIFVTAVQVVVMRAHMRATREHYHALLEQHKTGSCGDGDIAKWAAALLEITGTDFSPDAYRWLPMYDTEPRRKSRQEALSLLPRERFQVGTLTADSLTVPAAKRRPLWWWYLGLCLVSWIIFVSAIVLSHGALARPEPPPGGIEQPNGANPNRSE